MTTSEKSAGKIDPVVEAAPAEGWGHWARELGNYQPQRLLGFGGVVVSGFLAGVLLLYGFAQITDYVFETETVAVDAMALALVRQVASAQLDLIARGVSLMGSEVVMVVAAVLFVLFVWQRRWGAAGMLCLVTGGAWLLNSVLKEVFQRTRPTEFQSLISAQAYSFPSGHAMVSAAFYLYVAYLCWRLVRGRARFVMIGLLLLLVVLIGLSRIYLQAHYLSDVTAGYLAGFLWTDAVIVGGWLLITRRRRRIP